MPIGLLFISTTAQLTIWPYGDNLKNPYLNYVTGTHSLYDRYHADWTLCINSWYGGVEYKNAHYLRAYQVDMNQPSEAINTYVIADDGSTVGKSRAKIEFGTSSQQTNRGQDLLSGSFYLEKLDNTPLYNYVKLIVAEYNAILFRNPPQRVLPESAEIEEFLNNVDEDENSINEFMSQVDMYTTIYGVCHVSCIKPIGSEIPKWRVHTPLDITNWEYKFDIDGSLRLTSVVIKIDSNDNHSVYRLITESTIETIFVGADDDYAPPIAEDGLESLGENSYRYVQPNELGYVPLRTIYQSTKVYNNIGTTVVQDVAQIQRSIYGDMAEIYSAITYSSHPTLIIDETTDQLNDGQVGAEPGSKVRVQSSLTGQPTHVYEFKSPSLDAISEIRELVDNKVQKLSQIAMLRSEDLIKAANSGAQIEVYDDKLSAMIRRKATNLENAEAKLWEIWFDWLNISKPDDFSISYNRQYNRRALEIELKEVDLMMATLEKYESMLGVSAEYDLDDTQEEYATPELAAARAQQLGGSGFHSHEEDGTTVYMPFASHETMLMALKASTGRPEDAEAEEFKVNARNKIRERLNQLFNASTTDNGF